MLYTIQDQFLTLTVDDLGAQMMALTGSGLWEALGLAVIPFALFDLLKAALSSLLAVALHRALRRARLVVWSL